MPSREERLAEAERAVRRGELKEALVAYRGLLSESPEDASVRARIATIESLLQPQELSSAAQSPPALHIDLARPATQEQTAEMLFERGDVAGAIATYDRILRERPDHDLARERCAELQGLHRLNPAPPQATALPRSRPELFEALLARIATRRRP